MSCVSAFCNILQHFIGEIFGIPENVPRFQKNVFHIPDERQLGLASLQMVNFHKQRAITLESLVRYGPLSNLKKTSWY